MTDEVEQTVATTEPEAKPAEGSESEGSQKVATDETTEKSSTSETQETAESGEKTDSDKAVKGVQKRINELVRQREEEKREKEYWREFAVKSQKETKTETPKPEGKPDVSQFQSYEDYLEALADWKSETKINALRAESERSQRSHSQAQAIKTFDSKADKTREKYDDFDAVALDPSLTVSPPMTDAIMESEIGPEILYFLGNNQTEAKRIAALSPFAAAREIGRLEAKLLSKPVKKASSAPEPIKPVGSKEQATKDPDNLSVNEWIKMRNKEVHGKRFPGQRN